jgi:phage shock protein PspC (stress-responsive transcriptional regulator)
MNKIMNINIAGIVFHVNDNAYDKLKNYLEDINSHFRETEGGGEIIIDIEARIVELFQLKLSSKKQVITIEDVTEIISIMGVPTDFESENENSYTESEKDNKVRKRMFRDIDNRMIGGVCSGLGAYFGVDIVWFRLAFVVATLSGLSILAYLILWIIIPPAISISEKLEMRGNPVNISNIEKSIREEMSGLRDKFDDLASEARNHFRKKN